MSDVDWLSFTPRDKTPRRSQPKALGAHAFRAGPRSLCGSIARAQAGGPASEEARRCVWCERVIKGISPDRSGATEEVTDVG